MTRKVQKTIVAFGPVLRRKLVQALDLAVPGMGEDQAAQMRDLDRAQGLLLRHVGPAEQDQRHALAGLFDQWPSIAAILAGWYCSVLRPCWSPAKIWIGAVTSTIHIAIENIVLHPRVVAVFQQMPGAGGADEQRGRQEGREPHMHQPIGEGRVEDHLPASRSARRGRR